MKLIRAIIKPERLHAVKEKLNEIGVKGMTVSEVKGFGHQKGKTEFYRGNPVQVHFLPKTQIFLAVSDDKKDAVISAITEAAKTGKYGDGKIFINNLEEVVRIRTGEKNEEAL
ncbi:MAG: P-II family nitrogen regulator [Pelagibacteraceae bacterium]|jgi:nitrogen regulatory protein PII